MNNQSLTAMATSSFSSPLFLATASYSFLILIILSTATTSPLLLTLVNNCNFTLWPAIQPNAGHAVLERGGFSLSPLSHLSIPISHCHWSGRVWARTSCTQSNNRFTCATGDCGGGLDCGGAGGATPATLAELSLHQGHNDFSSYGVSLVDGFNVPITVTPHEGKGVCPEVGCRTNLLPKCPSPLQQRLRRRRGAVVACKSECEAFNTDELCCRNHYSSPQTCKASIYSQFFKRACPATFTFAHDTPSLMHNCTSPRELKVIFCH